MWRASLSAASADLSTLADNLSHEEHRRAHRYVFVADRRRAIISRGLLKGLIGRYLATPPCRIAITTGDQGKPSIPHMLKFNVTHSDDVIAFAFSSHDQIGIDVERINGKLDIASLASYVFSKNEIRALEAMEERERVNAFFAGWTRKEAFLKALGCGLTLPLEEIEVGIDPSAKPMLRLNSWQPNVKSCFSIVNVDLRQGYSSALAIERGTAPIICIRDIEA